MDTELGRQVVELGFATREELQECLSYLTNNKDDLKGQTLARILINQGVVTERQIRRVKKTIEANRGQEIPGYQLLSKLGSGAMATVFKARQLSLDRIVAIKVLPRKLSESIEYVKMFYKEGKAAAKLNHANIVQAFDVGEAGGFHYFVMEYVEGHTLWDELNEHKVFSEKQALDILIQIARALEHAHNQGLIHRDVKPKNIMITTDGIAKLADMGLARAASDEESAKAEAGRAFGTPYYISPEQIRGQLDIDFRADIYSLGATLYHVITGKVPFDAETPAGVMHKHLKEPLIPPDHIRSEISTGMAEVVEVMMAKDCNRRYMSTTDMLLDLEAIADGHPPLQARKQIDAGVLTQLADEEGESIDFPMPYDNYSQVSSVRGSNYVVLLIMLATVLAVSIILNIVQFVS